MRSAVVAAVVTDKQAGAAVHVLCLRQAQAERFL